MFLHYFFRIYPTSVFDPHSAAPHRTIPTSHTLRIKRKGCREKNLKMVLTGDKRCGTLMGGVSRWIDKDVTITGKINFHSVSFAFAMEPLPPRYQISRTLPIVNTGSPTLHIVKYLLWPWQTVIYHDAPYRPLHSVNALLPSVISTLLNITQ